MNDDKSTFGFLCAYASALGDECPAGGEVSGTSDARRVARQGYALSTGLAGG